MGRTSDYTLPPFVLVDGKVAHLFERKVEEAEVKAVMERLKSE